MQRKTIPGHFTRISDAGHHVGVSEEEARRQLTPTSRNVDEAISVLKQNPWAPLTVDGGAIRYEVHTAPVVTVPNGGPVLRGPHLFTPEQVVSHLLDLVADHAPTAYDRLFDRYQEVARANPDGFAAELMEVLDNVAGPGITFTARRSEHDDFDTLGFWPTQENPDE